MDRGPSAHKDGATVRSGAAQAGWTLVSRLTGLARVAVIAAVLGPTYLGNLFQATNLLPNITYEFLTGSLFASLLVPAVVRYADQKNSHGVARVAGGFLGIALLAFTVIAVVLIVAGPWVIRLLTLGVADPRVVAEQLRVGWPLLALLMPQVLFYATIGCAVAVQQAHGRFALAAAAPAVENIAIIAVLAGYATVLGGTTDVHRAGTDTVLWLGLGTTAAVGLHAATQWWGARRCGVTLLPRLGWRDPEVRQVVRLALPSLGYAGLNAARLIGILVVASSIPGGVVAFQLAFAFYNLPDALIGRPLAQAGLPALSRSHAAGDRHRFAAQLGTEMSLAVFLAVPAAVGYLVLARPIAEAVSTGNMAGARGTGLVASALAGLAPGTLGAVLFVIGTHAAYARRDARTPLVVMAIRSGLALVAMVILLAAPGSPTLLSLALVVSTTDLAAAVVVTALLARAVPLHRHWTVGRSTLRAGSAAAVMALAVLATVEVADPAPGAASVLATVAAGAVGGLTYLGVQRILRSPDLSDLRRGLRRGADPEEREAGA